MPTGSDRTAPLPSSLGGYRILRVLGEGGMGVVYEAEQDNPRRTVALKVVKPGFAQPSQLRRFELEAQVLGRLQHPGIAQIYEAGTADTGHGPQLFFAMELVSGENLIDFANSHRLGIGQRLELMAKICDAVHHAHQKGVIHRDLKPDNILVDDDGQPKVLDFGVARSTNADVETVTLYTDVGQLMGTVPYMSPEQVLADPDQLDLRSDVYALGVVLYELLAGQLPYDLSRKVIHEAVRIIRDEDPTPLSSVNRLLRGDVETIVQKALEKDRDRRYGSATEFGADIRYLDDEPIDARPPSTFYQLQKFARRHRALVGGVAAVFVALIAGTIVSVSQAVRASAAEALSTVRAEVAERNEREALAQMEQSDAVRAFLQDMLRAADPYGGNDPDITVREVLDAAAVAVEREALVQRPKIEAAVRIAVGSTYLALAAYERAAPHLQRALELYGSEYGDDHPDVAECRFWLAQLAAARGDFATADAELEASTAGFRRAFGDEHTRIARGLQLSSEIRYNQEHLDEAEAVQRQALQMRVRLLGNEHIDVADSMVGLGFLLRYKGDYVGAEATLRQALAIKKLRLGAAHPGVASALSSLADVLLANHDSEGAEQALREALDITRRFFADDHPSVPDLQWRLGNVLKARRHYAAAEPVLREALRKRRDLLGSHRDTATSLAGLGEVLIESGRTDEAEPLLQEALAMRRELYGDDGLAVAASLTDLAELRMRQRRHDDAEPLLRESMAIWDRAADEDPVGRCRTLFALGMVLQGRRDYAGAESAFREQLELRRRIHGDDHLRVAEGENVLASLLYRKGDKVAAEAMFREALDGFRQAGLGESVMVLDTLSNLGFVVGARGDLEAAEELLRDAADISRRLEPQGFYSPSHTLGRLATNLGQQQKGAEYEVTARDALQLAEQEFPAGHWELANARRRIGHSVAMQGRYADAEALLLESHAALAACQDPPPTAIPAAVDALVELYESWGKTAEAARWRAEKK